MKRKQRTLAWRYKKFFKDVLVHTPVVKSILLLVALWLLFAEALYLSEIGSEATSITTYGNALYWGIAAFSTAGIADRPVTGAGELIGGVWIVIGSKLFRCNRVNHNGLLYETFTAPRKTDNRYD